MIFVVVTTLVMLFKHETEQRTLDEEDLLEDNSTQSVAEAYVLLWRIVHLPAILSLIAALMTMKVKCHSYAKGHDTRHVLSANSVGPCVRGADIHQNDDRHCRPTSIDNGGSCVTALRVTYCSQAQVRYSSTSLKLLRP